MTWYEIPWELSENGSIKQHFRQFYKSIKASLCVPQPWCQISLPTHYQKLHMVEYHMQLRAEGALFLFVHQIICINISWHVNTISNINVLVCLAKQVKCLRGPSFPGISFFSSHAGCTGLSHNKTLHLHLWENILSVNISN